MVPMRLGRTLARPGLVLVVLAVPALTGCGLFDEGSTAEEAFEYLPADTFHVQFSDRKAMAERVGVDDLDPRDVSEDDISAYGEPFNDESKNAVADTQLTDYLGTMKGAPLNDLDVAWEAVAVWGNPSADGERSAATVWKVGDDVDFDALAEDLEDKGYDEGGSGDLPAYTADRSDVDISTNAIGGVYPGFMFNVLLDEDEQVVVAAVEADALDDMAAVITDDADSLADDGGMDELIGLADEDPEVAWLVNDGSDVCPDRGRPVPEQSQAEYDDLGRPDARAFFVYGDGDPAALLALQYGSKDEARSERNARERLVEDGVEISTFEPFDEVGDFELEVDEDVLLIELDYEGGARRAADMERTGSGPGVCVPETPEIAS